MAAQAGMARKSNGGPNNKAGPKKLGLTGSIAMGKSHAATGFRTLGVPVFDADSVVHKLLGPGGAGQAGVAALFPDAVVNAMIDRGRLGAIVFSDPDALSQLERFLHPLVDAYEDVFLARTAGEGHDFVVLEVPLLLETGRETTCDAVAVVSAPADLQEARAMKRIGMTPEKLAAIRNSQMPDEEKRARADFIIDTSGPKEQSLQAIEQITKTMRAFARSGADDFRKWKQTYA